MQNKEEIIKTYLFAICDTKNPRADKDNLLKIWLKEFDYIDEKEDYIMEFMEACRKVINDSAMFRMASPDDIKRIIRESLGEPIKPLGKKPDRTSKHQELYKQAAEILKEKERVIDKNRQRELMDEYWELCKEMCLITNTPFIKGGAK